MGKQLQPARTSTTNSQFQKRLFIATSILCVLFPPSFWIFIASASPDPIGLLRFYAAEPMMHINRMYSAFFNMLFVTPIAVLSVFFFRWWMWIILFMVAVPWTIFIIWALY